MSEISDAGLCVFLSVTVRLSFPGKPNACYGAEFEKWLGIHVRHRSPPGGVLHR